MEINALPDMPADADGYLLIDNETTYKVSTSTLKGDIVNNLTTTTPGSQLDARQGRLLNLAETRNEAALIAIDAVIDSEIALARSPQMMRLPAADTQNVIPTDASDMLPMVSYVFTNINGEFHALYTKLYPPQLGTKLLNLGGRFDGTYGTRVTIKAEPGATNEIVSGKTYNGRNQTRDDSGMNYFRNYIEEV